MRRGLVTMGAFGLLLGACAGGDEASPGTTQPALTQPPTSAASATSEQYPTPTATTPPAHSAPASTPSADGWFENVIDPAGAIFRTILLAGPDDLPVVIYERQADTGEMSVRLARCTDPTCTTVDVVDHPSPAGSWLVGASIRSDGAAVVVHGVEGGALLRMCADPVCNTVTELRFPDVSPSAIALDEEDRPLLVMSEWPDPNANEARLSLAICADARCSEHRSVEITRVTGGHGKVEIGFLPTGGPVVAYEVFGSGEMGAEKMDLAACTDAMCTHVVVPEIVDATDPTAPDLPMFAYIGGSTQATRLVRCIDATCARATDVEVYREFEGRMFSQLAPVAAALDDGTVVVSLSATPSWAGAGRGERGQSFAVRCVDAACDEVLVSEAPIASGDESTAVFLDDGIAVVTRSGLCDGDGDDCSEAEGEPPSRLDIRLCRGAGCVVGLATMATSESGVDASGAPLEGDIAFEKYGDVWLIESGTTEAVNLTESWEYWEGGPAFSPDGSRIAFHANRDDPTGENYDLYVMNRDGSEVTRLTDDPSAEFFPSWSPDGSRIVFARNNTTDDHRHLLILDVDTGQESELTDETHSGDIPRWSPDGTRIVFGRRTSGSCDWGEPCNSSIFVIDIDGTNETQLTFDEGVHWFPDWSPDGTRIAFHGTADDPLDRADWNIYSVEADGSGAITRLTEYGGTDQSPTWSPDGTRILFQSDRSGIGELYTMATDGSDIALVGSTTGASFGNDWTLPNVR